MSELESLIDGDFPELSAVLIRARQLAREPVDGVDELDDLLSSAPSSVYVDSSNASHALSALVRASGGSAPAVVRRSAVSMAASIPVGVPDLSEPEIRIVPVDAEHTSPPPRSAPVEPADSDSAPAVIPAAELGPPVSDFQVLPSTGDIPLSNLEPLDPVISRMASERLFDDDDFPDIETVDQEGLTPDFLDVGTMGSESPGPDIKPDVKPDVDADIADVAIDDMFDASPPIDAGSASHPEPDAAGPDFEREPSMAELSLTDLIVDDSGLDLPPPPGSHGIPDHDLDLEGHGPSGLELALQSDDLGLPSNQSRQIAPPDTANLSTDSTMVMNDVSPGPTTDSALEFDSAEPAEPEHTRSSMSMEFDARALDADGLMASDLGQLTRGKSNPADDLMGSEPTIGSLPGVPTASRKPPLPAPPRTEAVAALDPPEHDDAASGSDVDDMFDDLSEELSIDDDLVLIEEADSLATPPPVPGAPRPAPPIPPPPGLQANADMQFLDSELDSGLDVSEHDGDPDNDPPKKKGFFRRLFNK